MKLLFKKPVFHPGTNMTVRSGPKWFDWYNENPDGKIEAAVTDGPELGNVLIKDAVLVRFWEVRDEWLRQNHDPACQEADGLLAEMKKLYPDFTPDSQVSVLFFTKA